MSSAPAARGRKRARGGGGTSDADLPKIPGVPPDLVPLLVESLKATRKVFQKDKTGATVDPFRVEHLDEDQQHVAATASANALNNVLDRIEQSNVDQTLARKAKQRYSRMLESQQQFFSALGRLDGIRSNNHHNSSQQQQQAQVQPQPRKSIALACFHYSWKLQEHKLMDVRRGSLNLCAKILAKDEHVRHVWTSNLMLEWLQSVVNSRNGAMMLWQSEAKWVLQVLADSHGDTEPRYVVGVRLLQQRCPQTQELGADTKVSLMAQMRVDRDFAMLHGNKECEILEKLIVRANTYLLILVPRIGQEEGAAVAVVDDGDDDLEVDDDDIDWEEGDEQDAKEAHASAVEQTLTMMEATGRLKGGDLEVSLTKDGDDANVVTASSAPESSADDKEKSERCEVVRTNLGKISKSLSNKHMKRLTSWLHALSNADHLIQQPGSSSLIVMSEQQTRQRRDLRNRLLHMKTEVSSILASANKLHISLSKDAANVPEVRAPTNLTNVPRRHENLTQAMQRRRVGSAGGTNRQVRSNRIQIKYRK